MSGLNATNGSQVRCLSNDELVVENLRNSLPIVFTSQPKVVEDQMIKPSFGKVVEQLGGANPPCVGGILVGESIDQCLDNIKCLLNELPYTDDNEYMMIVAALNIQIVIIRGAILDSDAISNDLVRMLNNIDF